MKKFVRFSTILVIVSALLVLSIGTVFAIAPIHPITTWTDPVAFVADKGVTFTADVKDPSAMPGTVNNDGGMIFPVGFTSTQGQFGGKGILISDLTAGKFVDICFNFPVYRYSWAGTIYSWTGTKWVAMPTTIVEDKVDETNTKACTKGVGDGVYALIMHFWGTPQAFVPVY